MNHSISLAKRNELQFKALLQSEPFLHQPEVIYQI